MQVEGVTTEGCMRVFLSFGRQPHHGIASTMQVLCYPNFECQNQVRIQLFRRSVISSAKWLALFLTFQLSTSGELNL
jgi:hypothetical protein